MADYEKLFFTLIKRVDKVKDELNELHNEITSLYLDERLRDELIESGIDPDMTGFFDTKPKT